MRVESRGRLDSLAADLALELLSGVVRVLVPVQRPWGLAGVVAIREITSVEN